MKEELEIKEEAKALHNTRGYIIEVCPELLEILDIIKKNVREYTWGAEEDIGNFKASKILANRIRQAKIY